MWWKWLVLMQAGNFLHYISRFLAGFTIGFIRVWQISLVTLSIVPLIALAGGIYAYVTIGLIARVRKSYIKAGEIAEEVCTPTVWQKSFLIYVGRTLLKIVNHRCVLASHIFGESDSSAASKWRVCTTKLLSISF